MLLDARRGGAWQLESGGGGVELNSNSVNIAKQSLLVFVECWSIFSKGDRRIMELERASLLLSAGHQIFVSVPAPCGCCRGAKANNHQQL